MSKAYRKDLSGTEMQLYYSQVHSRGVIDSAMKFISRRNWVLKSIPLNQLYVAYTKRQDTDSLHKLKDKAKEGEFVWDESKAKPLIAARSYGGGVSGHKFNIIDGRHRAVLAKACGIESVKVYVPKDEITKTASFVDMIKAAGLSDISLATGPASDPGDCLDYTKLSYDRTYYMQNRARISQRSRQYRMRNLAKIKRRAKIYRSQLKRGRKPRQRIGAPGAGYTYIATGGVNFSQGTRF